MKSNDDNQQYSASTRSSLYNVLAHIDITLSSFSHKQISLVTDFEYVYTVDRNYNTYPCCRNEVSGVQSKHNRKTSGLGLLPSKKFGKDETSAEA